MNTTNKQDETLAGAARKQFENVGFDKLDERPLAMYLLGNEFGANWQKEQDKIIIDKLIDGLKDSQYYLETAINATPAGSIRNILTEANIRVMSLLNSLK